MKRTNRLGARVVCEINFGAEKRRADDEHAGFTAVWTRQSLRLTLMLGAPRHAVLLVLAQLFRRVECAAASAASILGGLSGLLPTLTGLFLSHSKTPLLIKFYTQAVWQRKIQKTQIHTESLVTRTAQELLFKGARLGRASSRGPATWAIYKLDLGSG